MSLGTAVVLALIIIVPCLLCLPAAMSRIGDSHMDGDCQ